MVRPVWLAAYYLSGYLGASCCFKLEVTGEKLAGEGPVVLMGKHVSNWDIPLSSRAVRKYIGNYPHYEMGSFHGYPVLGKITALLKWCGGFPVMRAKDLLRLKHTTGESKESLRALMKQVNDEAAETRRGVLRENQSVCFFPEGTRDKNAVNKLRSTHEVEEALTLRREEGLRVRFAVVIPCYGPKPGFFIPFIKRRPVTVKFFGLEIEDNLTPHQVLDEAKKLFDANWTSESASTNG